MKKISKNVLTSALVYDRIHITKWRKRKWPLNTVGVYYAEGPPVPIPNTVVKLMRAKNSWRAASRKDRSTPTWLPQKLYE